MARPAHPGDHGHRPPPRARADVPHVDPGRQAQHARDALGLGPKAALRVVALEPPSREEAGPEDQAQDGDHEPARTKGCPEGRGQDLLSSRSAEARSVGPGTVSSAFARGWTAWLQRKPRTRRPAMM